MKKQKNKKQNATRCSNWIISQQGRRKRRKGLSYFGPPGRKLLPLRPFLGQGCRECNSIFVLVTSYGQVSIYLWKVLSWHFEEERSTSASSCFASRRKSDAVINSHIHFLFIGYLRLSRIFVDAKENIGNQSVLQRTYVYISRARKFARADMQVDQVEETSERRGRTVAKTRSAASFVACYF